MENKKLIFLINRTDDGLVTFMSSSTVINEVLDERIYDSNICNAVKTTLAKNEYGKFDINDNFVIFILHESVAPLHTIQYPLVIIKNNEIIDIDEGWYSDFKPLLADKYKGTRVQSFKDFLGDDEDDDCLSASDALDIWRICRCTNVTDENDVLIAVRTTNISFNKD